MEKSEFKKKLENDDFAKSFETLDLEGRKKLLKHYRPNNNFDKYTSANICSVTFYDNYTEYLIDFDCIIYRLIIEK